MFMTRNRSVRWMVKLMQWVPSFIAIPITIRTCAYHDATTADRLNAMMDDLIDCCLLDSSLTNLHTIIAYCVQQLDAPWTLVTTDSLYPCTELTNIHPSYRCICSHQESQAVPILLSLLNLSTNTSIKINTFLYNSPWSLLDDVLQHLTSFKRRWYAPYCWHHSVMAWLWREIALPRNYDCNQCEHELNDNLRGISIVPCLALLRQELIWQHKPQVRICRTLRCSPCGGPLAPSIGYWGQKEERTRETTARIASSQVITRITWEERQCNDDSWSTFLLLMMMMLLWS